MKLSYTRMDGTSKADRRTMVYYTDVVDIEFNKLPHLLAKDTMYSPFTYAYNKRSKENLNSNASFIVLDVDTTSIDALSRHLELIEENLNHIVATTSDLNNQFKYRVLFELSRDVTPLEYTQLVNGIREYGLLPEIDHCSTVPSQPFYSYMNSQVLSYYDGEKLDVETYLLEELHYDPISVEPSTICDHLAIKFRNPPMGKGVASLLSAKHTLKEYGLSRDVITSCLNHINSQWIAPLSQQQLKSRVL